MTTRHNTLMTAVVLISALVGAAAVAGPAAALGASTAAPFPHSPGTTVETFPVSVTAQPGDAVTKNGMKSMTLNYGADSNFDGSVKNVSTSDVSVFVTTESGQRQVGSVKVTTKPNGQITLEFRNPVRVSAGNRIVARIGNVTTPTTTGGYTIGVSATGTNGATDGPVTVDYRVVAADISFPNQSASQFGANQTVTISGVVPNAGYVAVFTKTANGSRGKLVGNSKPILATYDRRNYTVNLNGKVAESQPLMAVVYYETSGDTQATRLNSTFDPKQDEPVTNNGVLANATGYVTTVNANGRLTAGNEYDQGARLYFTQNAADTSYRISTVENGSLGRTVNQFETAANGTATIDTANLKKGQYAITRIDNGSVVSLDDDSTTSIQDDSFFITGQQFATNTTSAAGNGTSGGSDNATKGGANASGNGTTGSANASAGTNASTGGNGSAGGNGNGSAGGNGSGNASGGDSGGSGAFGPGFGVVVAVLAVLGAALIAARKR